jgi:hypothetical protein
VTVLEIEAFRIATPTTNQLIILLIIVFLVALIFFLASRRVTSRSVTRRAPRGSGWGEFYQYARTRGLSKNETEILRKLAINYGLAKPANIFTSTNILDSCIQRAVRKLSLQEIRGESKDDMINLYYRLRNKITRFKRGRAITSTRSIPVGVKVRLGIQKYGFFSANIVDNDANYIALSIPGLPPGRRIPWNHKKVRFSYWRENDAVYVIETKVAGTVQTDEEQSLRLRHTDRIRRIQKRLYPRMNVRLPVFFSKLRVVEENGKKKAFVERSETHWGTIIDLSVGGLSIETTAPYDRNQYLRVEFELREEYKVVGVGKVKRIERNAARKTWIMHIQFTKISKKNKNEIFAVLYNYQTI